jgi:hypothetical protein
LDWSNGEADAGNRSGGADSPKRHGDKLKTGTEPALPKESLAASGDSPKRQGDKLERAVKQADKK